MSPQPRIVHPRPIRYLPTIDSSNDVAAATAET
jgi:hypothetical protein